ncbi:MAG TPA: response regulator [Actinomycetota bacterium]|nr:response regulator [Actinomycetota bacterium]
MRILVIDDEPDVLLLCRVNLEYEGHEVLEASGGEEGLHLAVRYRPDLIVLDVMLPEKDGFSVLRRLRQHTETADVPVIFLTAKAQDDDQIRGFLAGASEYVTKPFSPLALNLAVSRIAAMSPDERETRRTEHLARLSILGGH